MMNGVKDADADPRAYGGYCNADPYHVGIGNTTDGGARLGVCRCGCGHEQGVNRYVGEDASMRRSYIEPPCLLVRVSGTAIRFACRHSNARRVWHRTISA